MGMVLDGTHELEGCRATKSPTGVSLVPGRLAFVL